MVSDSLICSKFLFIQRHHKSEDFFLIGIMLCLHITDTCTFRHKVAVKGHLTKYALLLHTFKTFDTSSNNYVEFSSFNPYVFCF